MTHEPRLSDSGYLVCASCERRIPGGWLAPLWPCGKLLEEAAKAAASYDREAAR